MRRNRIVSLALAGALALALSVVVSAPASASDHTYQLRNLGDLCLQSVNKTQDLGAEIVQNSCDGTSDQRWVFRSLGGTRYRIENENSARSRCMDVFGGAANLTSVVQWSCSSISNETWDPGVVLNGGYTVITALRTRVAGT